MLSLGYFSYLCTHKLLNLMIIRNHPTTPRRGNEQIAQGIALGGRWCFIAFGLHNDAIDKWSASERNDLLQWLNSLGFDL